MVQFMLLDYMVQRDLYACVCARLLARACPMSRSREFRVSCDRCVSRFRDGVPLPTEHCFVPPRIIVDK